MLTEADLKGPLLADANAWANSSNGPKGAIPEQSKTRVMGSLDHPRDRAIHPAWPPLL